MHSEAHLHPTRFINYDSEKVQQYTREKIAGLTTDAEKAVALYYAVRDDILYNPYNLILDPGQISASLTLERGSGYCIEKSLLLAATARFAGIPSRLGFSIVRNHLATEKFIRALRTDKFVFHGYNEFWIENSWVKCTPAFNKSLCEKFDVAPLEFDGVQDSIFHEYAPGGARHMEYIHEYGQFDDFPYELFVSELRIHYPHFFEKELPLRQDYGPIS